MRWKPLLGKGKKEIACERARESGRWDEEGRQSRPPPPFLSLLIRQFMALLFNKAIQGGEAQWTRCSRRSIAMNPRLVCIGVTYLRRGPTELSVSLCVLYRPPLWLLQALADFPPEDLWADRVASQQLLFSSFQHIQTTCIAALAKIKAANICTTEWKSKPCENMN